MKIVQNPRTMNLSTLMQRAARICSFLLVMLFSTNLFGVDYVKVVRLEVQIGDTLVYDFYAECLTSPPEIEFHTFNPIFGNATIDPGFNNPWHYGQCFSGTHTVEYIPNVSQVQRDTFYIAYDIKNSDNLIDEYFDIIIIDIVSNSIRANNDYATTTINNSVTIDVLANDESDFDGVVLDFIALQNNGSCTTDSNNNLVFTPAQDFHGVATIEYTACNSDGSCDVASVYIGVDNELSETLDLFVHENKDLVVYDALEDYSVSTAPLHGTFEYLPDYGFHLYTPDLGVVNVTDVVVLQASSGDSIIEKELIFDIINNPTPNILTKEDNFWACESDYIDFSVLSNDLIPSMSIAIVGQPTYGESNYLGNGQMDYSVYPETTAKKRDVAIYRAAAFNWSWIEYSKINFHIDEFLPNEVTYKLKTTKNVPLVLEYNTLLMHPIEMSVESEPAMPGAPQLELLENSYTWNNQTCTGGRMVVFTPLPDMAYTEEFKLVYSPGNDNEYTIKVEVEVVDGEDNATLDCIGNNCVWPGDMDNNGVVDARDILLLGYGIGSVGTPREAGNNEWFGQYSDSWEAPVYGTPIDYKYLDSNGDGQVDYTDTVAVFNNYGLESDIYPSRIYGVGNVNVDASYGEGTMLERAPLYFFPHPDNPYGDLYIGDVLLSDIHLGIREKQARDIHGLAFTLTYETLQLDSTSVSINFDKSSWLTQNSSVIEMTESPKNGFLDAALTRTHSNSISGFGKIGQAEFIIIIDVDGVKSDRTEMEFKMDGITIMDGSGELMHYPPTTFSVPVYTGNTEHISPTLLAYPNPTEGVFNLHLNGGLDKIIESYEIFSLDGKLVKSENSINSKSRMIDLSGNTAGVYAVKVITTTGIVLNQKIEIIE